MKWFVEKEGDTFLIRAPIKEMDVLADAMITVDPGESFRGIPYDKLEDGQVFEEDERGFLKELTVKDVREMLKRRLES